MPVALRPGRSAQRGRHKAETAVLGRAEEAPPLLELRLIESPASSAGFPSPAADYLDLPLDLNQLLVRNPVATFYVRSAGDSMVDAHINDGDILVVDRSIRPTFGRIVVAAYDSNLLVKRYGQVRGQAALVSENSAKAAAYPPIIINPELELVLWGVVTGVVRKL